MRKSLPIANAKNLRDAFKNYRLSDERHINWHGFARALRAAEGGTKKVREMMEEFKALLEAPGIEAIEGAHVGGYWGNFVATFVNVGDLYSPTVIYDVLAQKFYVGGEGDWREWRENHRDYKLSEPDY